MKKISPVLMELRNHAPFTLFGAATGILCMLLFRNLDGFTNLRLFQIFHPTHVVLSSMVTTSLYLLHKKKLSIIKLLLIGYVGSIGVATLSDCILPFFGESILGVAVPSEHSHTSEPKNEEESKTVQTNESEKPEIHLGFIEEWYIVNPAAFLGMGIAYFLPRTKFPHAGHILISTWASSFHILMNTHHQLSPVILAVMFFVLFISVWLPCCVSDIVFPMLFIKPGEYEPHHHHHH
jgi:hypothetical protein